MGDASGGGAGRGRLQRAGQRDRRAAAAVHPPPSVQVHRQRLERRLDEGLDRGLVVVSAPAGAGKTQLLTSWAAAHDGPVAWASLGPDDRDPMHLWAHVLASLQAATSALSDSLLSRMRPTPVLDERFVTRLLDAWESLSQPVVLVLDDVHALDGSGGADSLADALRRGPGRLPLVLSTRTAPLLPLHRLRLLDAVTELDARSLAFTPAEAHALFELHAVPLSPEQLLQVLDRTEGWAAGLRLAVLALRGRTADLDDAVAQLAGDQRGVVDYFAREVLDRVAPDLTEFMVRTCVVPRVCASLADTLTDGTDGQSVLEDLVRENLFVVALDEHQGWFRYHHLFADALRQRLAALPPDVERDLHRRAARWSREHADPLEACRQLAAAGDWHALAVFTCTTAGALALDLTRPALAQVLRALPSDLVVSDAWVAAAAAIGSYAVYDVAGVHDHVSEARSTLEDVPAAHRPVLEAVLATLETFAAWLDDDSEAQVRTASAALDALALLGSGVVPALAAYRTSVRSVLGMGQLWSGRLAQAESTLDVTVSALAAAPTLNPLVHVHVHGALGVIAGLQGRLNAASDQASTALTVAEDSGWLYLPQAARGHLALAIVLLLRDDRAGCAEAIERGRACLRNLPNRFIGTALDLADVRLRVSSGDVAGAETRLARLRGLLDAWHPPRFLLRWCDVVEGEVGLARGDAAGVAARLAGGIAVPGDERPSSHQLTVLARAHLELGAPERALEVLVPLHADPPGELVAAVDLWLLTALARDRLGQEADAATALGESVELAAADGIVRPFLLVGEPAQQLLRRHRGQLAHQPQFVQPLLDHLARPVARPVPEHPLPPLTDRELSTLRLLPTMMTNAEIAAELYLSVNTVKTHLKSLYRKLGVAGRREAVVIARELGLLDE